MGTIINYEDIVRDKIIDNLKYMFGIENEDALMLYLISRYQCLKERYMRIEDIDERDFMEFILQECGVVLRTDGIRFTYGETITISYLLKNENSLPNIYEEFIYCAKNVRLRDRNGIIITDINKDLKEVYNIVHRNAMVWLIKQDCCQHKVEIRTLAHLQELNKLRHVHDLRNPKEMEGFEQNDNLLLREIGLARYLNVTKINSTSFKNITEATLRDFLIKRLDLIEDGLELIEKEYVLKEGRVDILAKDKNENIVIIELKIENDKRLIWQCLYYPEEVKKKYPKRNVRMITIAPEYPDYLLGPLNHIENIEKFKVSVVSTNGTLEEVKLDKL